MKHRNFRAKAVLSMLILCGLSVAAKAQTLKEFFSNESTPLTYLGVDFSLARVQGESATANDMRDKFEAINNVIVNEAKKYDIADAFNRSSVKNDLTAINKKNAAVNTESIKTENSADMSRLKPEDIARAVKSYDLSGHKGIGLVFIMEGMSKPEKEGYVYATLIDMSTKKVLHTERMREKAQGFGFRNYWAYTIYKALEGIDKHEYKTWKGKYENQVEEVVVKEEVKAAAPATPAEAKKAKKKKQ